MKKKETYQLVTLENGNADAAAIANILGEMAAGDLRADLTLLNYYHEVPVSYGATILGIEKDALELSVHEHQAMVIKNDGSTLIKSRHFPSNLGVHCYAAYVNVQKKTVILHNFAYAQIRAERRDAVRVKIDRPMTVAFSCAEVKSTGTLVDISGNGLSVQFPDFPQLSSEQTVQLSFDLLGNPISVHGAFVRAIADGPEGHICSFRVTPDSRSDTIIGRFIYQRQIEIIQDLKSCAATA